MDIFHFTPVICLFFYKPIIAELFAFVWVSGVLVLTRRNMLIWVHSASCWLPGQTRCNDRWEFQFFKPTELFKSFCRSSSKCFRQRPLSWAETQGLLFSGLDPGGGSMVWSQSGYCWEKVGYALDRSRVSCRVTHSCAQLQVIYRYKLFIYHHSKKK